MKYIAPTLLMLIPFCPHSQLSSFAAVAVFATGVVFGLMAYGKDDMPYIVG